MQFAVLGALEQRYKDLGYRFRSKGDYVEMYIG